jgi:hypothetical protein
LIATLQQNNKIELIKFQSEVTLEKAIEGSQLSKIKKSDKAGLIKAIKNLIVSLSDSLNLSVPLDEAQIFEIALLTIEQYYFLKLDELVLIFKNAKLGKYGKIYNRLDIQIIFEWIEQYLKSEERALYFERINKRRPDLETADMKKVYQEYMDRKEESKSDEDSEFAKFRQEYLKNKILKDGQSTNNH